MRYFSLIAALCLCACAAQLPTSERLEAIKVQKIAALETEVARYGKVFGQPLFIRIFKEEEDLEAWLRDPHTGRYNLFKTYPICKFSGTLGPKLAEGDGQAPEGFYEVGARQMNPWSEYNLSFDLGYPNQYDRMHGRTGSKLMIHGSCKSIGCFAMTDAGIEEIYLLAEASIREGHKTGQRRVPVHIFPFRMTPENMAAHAHNEWMPFWMNLQDGYTAFEKTGMPPHTTVKNGAYAFQGRSLAAQIADLTAF